MSCRSEKVFIEHFLATAVAVLYTLVTKGSLSFLPSFYQFLPSPTGLLLFISRKNVSVTVFLAVYDREEILSV